MGKKPFILVAIGLFLIAGVFIFGISDPSCGRGKSMNPGDVCVDESSGKKQTYEEAKALQDEQFRIVMPVVGGAVVLYGVYTAVKRKRNPNWRAEAAAKKQAAAAAQTTQGGPPAQPMHGGPVGQQFPDRPTAPPQYGPPQYGGPVPPGGTVVPPAPGGQPYPPQQGGPPPQQR